ncbi:ATP synthase subunit C [Vallitaleaceae bacterium 9-2]
MEFILVITVILVATTVGIGVWAIKRGMNNKKATKVLGINIGTFFLLMIGATVYMLSGDVAMAQDTAVNAAAGISNGEGLKFIGAALSTGMASIGAGIAVAASGAAAIGAISEDTQLLGKTIIFVGLSEGIAIYGLIISIMILG